jgi:hypothetical protein
MTDRRTWQKQETRVAKALGGQRIPYSGSGQFEGEEGDVFHKNFEIECKYRSPRLRVIGWFKEVRQRARKSKKIPMLVVREKGTHGDYVIMELNDFSKVFYGVIGSEVKVETLDEYLKGEKHGREVQGS